MTNPWQIISEHIAHSNTRTIQRESRPCSLRPANRRLVHHGFVLYLTLRTTRQWRTSPAYWAAIWIAAACSSWEEKKRKRVTFRGSANKRHHGSQRGVSPAFYEILKSALGGTGLTPDKQFEHTGQCGLKTPQLIFPFETQDGGNACQKKCVATNSRLCRTNEAKLFLPLSTSKCAQNLVVHAF